MLELKDLNVNDRFVINSNLRGHEHHKKAVYAVTDVGGNYVSAENLNEQGHSRGKMNHTFTETSFSALSEYAERIGAPVLHTEVQIMQSRCPDCGLELLDEDHTRCAHADCEDHPCPECQSGAIDNAVLRAAERFLSRGVTV